MKQKRIFKSKHPSKATAEHLRDDDHDYVKLGDLGVLVARDGDWWCAQGLEIDYTAQGKSYEEVMENFTRGLLATADAYLEEFGSIEKFLRPSANVLRELAKASERKLLKVTLKSIHDLHRLPAEEPAARALPFSGIRFFERLGEPLGANA